MKKMFFSLILATIVSLTSCTKDDAPIVKPDPIEEAIIGAIFNAGSTGLNSVGPTMAPAKRFILKSATADIPINQTLDFTEPGEAGGSVRVTGSVTGNYSDTGNSTMVMNMTEAFQNYGIIVDTKTYTSTGSISYKGNISVNSSSQSMTAKFTIGGSLLLVGESYNKTTAMQLVINESVKGTTISMSVSGTVGGKAVNYSESMNMQ
jgi:hypothetical protein